MKRRSRLLAAFLCLVVVAGACSHDRPKAAKPVSCKVSRNLVSGCGVWWGAFVSPDSSQDDPGAAEVLQLEHQIGRKLAIVHLYHDMSVGRRGAFPDATERALGTDRLLLIAWASRVYGGVNYTWRQIADGTLDRTVIDPAARRVAAYGRRLFIDFDHEPETPPPVDGPDADYRAAFRHIHQRFVALGATNAVWLWTTTGVRKFWGRYDTLYPGDDVVDWVAWDPYDFNQCRHGDPKSFSDALGPFYDWLVERHPSKPFMLAEYGTVSDPTDPGPSVRWYGDTIATLKDRPRIRAVVQFDQYPGGEGGRGCDTRLRPKSVLQAWGRASHDPYVDPPLP